MKNFLIKFRSFIFSGVFGFLLFLFICFVSYNFFPQKCKTLKIIPSLKDLGISVIYDCIDENLIKDNIKKKLKITK